MKSIYYLILMLLISLKAQAFFEKDLHVLNMENGLADNTVMCIHKDQDGFMWFGTNNGLSRYDGSKIKNFTIPEQIVKVTNIKETENNLLWILGNNRLYCFDRKREFFIPVDREGFVYDFIVPDDTVLWTIFQQSICRYIIDYENDKSGNIIYIRLRETNAYKDLLSGNVSFSTLCYAGDDNFYLGSSIGRVYVFDIGSEVLKDITRWSEKSNMTVRHLLLSDSILWISTIAGGLIQYNTADSSFRQYTYTPDNLSVSLSHTDVYQFVPVNNDFYLAATWNGYTVLVPDKKNPGYYTTEVYNNTASQVHRNLETRMISAYYDPNGILWMGTQGGGVFSSDLRRQFCRYYNQDTHNEICGIEKDRDGYLWLATFHQGLLKSENKFDPNGRLFFEQVITDAGACLLCAASDSAGNLWFAGDNNVLTQYNSLERMFYYYPVNLPDNPMWKSLILSIHPGNNQQIWLGTGNGLLLFDVLSGTFSCYDLKVGNIRAIEGDSDSALWLGTSYGLKYFDIGRGIIVSDDYEKKAGVPVGKIRSLFASTDNYVYIGYEDGFGLLDTESDSITGFYTTKDGLCSNFIGCITEDNRNHLWLGSNSGISYYNKQRRQFYNYYISGSNRSVLRTDDCLIWGNNKNVTYFNPADIGDNHAVSEKVLITQLEVDNKIVNIGEKINRQIILKKGISYVDRIRLNHSNRDFSLLFSNLSYSGNMQKYEYRLLPYQKEWIVCNEGERITYTNLPENEYAFEVRSISPDGASSDITSLDIEILPPWNKTFWFRLLLVAFALAVIYYIIYRTKKRQRQIEQEALLKNELSIARIEREKEKEMRRERENFFTDVSHELRTPLTLIISPLQEILQKECLNKELHHKLSLVYNNASSLSTLTNHLLYLQKAEAGKVQPDITKADLCSLVEKIAASFRPLADLRKDEFIVNITKDCMEAYIDVPQMESAIRNILSNAFKYTKSPGRIEITLREMELDDEHYGVCIINDNGPGIPEDLQEYIFQPFAVGRDNPAFSTKTGIGLRIVKNIMDMHHGRILLNSSPGRGTAFSLYIPLGKEHLSDILSVSDKVCTDVEREDTIIYTVADERECRKTSFPVRKMLIIEDNDEVRAYIRSLFLPNYYVLEAENGEAGIIKAVDEIPDIIISDIMMPVMNGFECCREIRKNSKTAHIPIMMLTAKTSDADILRSTEIGVDDYIIKPFNPEVLKSKVLNLINIREELKRIYTKALMLHKTADESNNSDESGKDLFIQQVINIIETHLSDADFGAKSLASRMNMSHPTLYRKMKQYSDLSVIEIIRSVRISKAASLALRKKYSVQEIAEMVGYNDIGSFRKHFIKQFGVPPSKYSE